MGDSPSARLREFRAHLGLDQKELAARLGVSQGVLGFAERGERKPSKALIANLFEKYRVNQTWLMHGEGEMFLPQVSARPIADAPEDPDYVRVARYRVSVAAGNGAVNYDEAPDGYIAFPRAWMTGIGVIGTDCGLVEVTGDSMGYTIRAGSLALVDFSVRQFVPSKIFVFRQGDEVRVKRVLPGIGGVALISDNPQYDDEVVVGDEAAQISVIGQVRAVISKV